MPHRGPGVTVGERESKIVEIPVYRIASGAELSAAEAAPPSAMNNTRRRPPGAP